MQELNNFKDQNLNLDYLTLNITNSIGQILEFAKIFFRYGFNSKVFYVATNESQIILEDKKLFHTLTFQATSENLQFYRLLQFIYFVRKYSGKKEIVNGQNYITVQFRLLDFMKTLNCQANSYQRQQLLQFFNQLQSLPPFREKFSVRKFRQLLFFPVVNAIQETKCGPWIIQISVAEHLMKDAYPFHLPPSFFTYSNKINLDVKLSIIQALAQEYSIQKIYDVQSFLNKFAKRRHSIQANIKRDIIHEFQNLIKFKIIESRFLFQRKDNQPIIEKDFIEIEDLISSKYIIFYEIISPF